MTNEEAIKNIVAYVYYADYIPEEVGKALDIAIASLKEQKDRYNEGYADGFSDGSSGILLRLTKTNGTTLMDIKKSIVAELEEKGIEPNAENITKRLEDLMKNEKVDNN